MNEQNPFSEWLSGLAANLQVLSPEDESKRTDLFDLLKKTVGPATELSQTKAPGFSFEKIATEPSSILSQPLQQQVSDIVSASRLEGLQNQFKVFQREFGVRSTQVSRSMPSWAAGAAVEKTIGPFINLDGRRIWFDFFRVEKLVALYFSDASTPAILFNIDVLKISTVGKTALLAPASQQYNLTGKSSIWINSRILAPNAPASKYTGLTIQSGTISLSEMPVITGDKTTLSTTNKITVKLKLKQQTVIDANDKSLYGADARVATFILPDTLEFEFNSTSSKITAVNTGEWNLFKQACSFKWKNTVGVYNADLVSLFIPFAASVPEFTINESLSPFVQPTGNAKIIDSYWNLPAADLDLSHISPAAGIGAWAMLCNKGITIAWTGLQNGSINLNICMVIAHPEGIAMGTTIAGNFYCRQNFALWKDDKNPHPSGVKIEFGKQFPLQYFSTVNGYEIIQASVNATVEADRPIDVSARPLPVHTKASVFTLTAFEKDRTIKLYDNNLLEDNFVTPSANEPLEVITQALALRNALFTTSPVTGCFLTGDLALDWKKVVIGNLYLSLGIYKYLPMLADPYAANVSIFQQFKTIRITDTVELNVPIMLLICLVKWGVREGELPDDVDSSFHLLAVPKSQVSNSFKAIINSNAGITLNENEITNSDQNITVFSNRTEEQAMLSVKNPTYDWSKSIDDYFKDDFSLLDVSSRANQMGVSFGQLGSQRESLSFFRTFGVDTNSDQLQSLYSVPFKIEHLQVTSPSLFVRSFTLPQIAWEPVHNLTPKQINGDPPQGMNFYPDDGGPARFFNNSFQYVPLEPRPVIKDIIRRYKEVKTNFTIAYFTLPFGLKALTVLSKHKQSPTPPSIESNRPVFKNGLRGGIQLQFNAGKLSSDEYPMFNGATIQLANVLDANGAPSAPILAGTLGQSVSSIFNKEFEPKTPLITSRGVPLTRIDFSGYGANIFSNWFNPNAEIAQTSQAKFDVFTGRTAHEVIQVRSIVYPWGIHVVRTIVLYRTNTGYVYRVDTGWQAESDGTFDFTYHIKKPGDEKPTAFPSHFHIHPGVIKGLFNIKNIVEINTPPFKTNSAIKVNDWYLDANNNALQNTSGADITKAASLQKITFDADVEVEGVIQGHVKVNDHANGLVPSRQVVGYVQLAPMGVPLSTNAFTDLILQENGAIGGGINCVVDINNSRQRMRLNGFDVSNEMNDRNANTVFVAAARGSVILPKDGSWSMVTHRTSSGEVSPLPENITVPLIRIGTLALNVMGKLELNPKPENELLRIADPKEIKKVPDFNTINYGFMQNTGTQKTLFLTPVFQQNVEQLLSKTPPLFADAYHVISSKGIFPNIGDAINNFKDAHPLALDHFLPGAIADAGKQVYQLMQVGSNVADAAGNLQDQAYKLLKQLPEFELPNQPLNLIDEDFLKVYIEYKNSSGNKLGFDINSLAGESADKWKSRLNNIAMVVDLGSFKRLMTIRGDFNAKKGSESNFGGAEQPADVAAKIEFSSALEAVIAILQILQDLSGGNYKDAIKKGLKIAMSNTAGTWEYKFEAVKEIPVVKFPPGILYNDPTQPLKLEASLKVGVYFNSALMITTDAKKLLPTVGAFVGFYGQVTVMCVSLAAATVYAVGQVTLDIAADTAKGPSLHMKFGFGAQIVVGLPVVGNVSVLYMVGVEIFKDKDKLIVSAFLLFKGHAELLGGIVGITITIEAKGTIERIESQSRTNCIVQVNFAIDISIFLVINIDFSTSWEEQRQIA